MDGEKDMDGGEPEDGGALARNVGKQLGIVNGEFPLPYEARMDSPTHVTLRYEMAGHGVIRLHVTADGVLVQTDGRHEHSLTGVSGDWRTAVRDWLDHKEEPTVGQDEKEDM